MTTYIRPYPLPTNVVEEIAAARAASSDLKAAVLRLPSTRMWVVSVVVATACVILLAALLLVGWPPPWF